MQDKKTNKEKKQNSGKGYIDRFFSGLAPGSELQARERLKRILLALSYGLLAKILSGGVFLFGTQPFGLALLASTENHLISVYAGIFLAVWSGKAPWVMFWGASCIFIFRLIVSFVPDFHEKKRDDIKALSIDLSSLPEGYDENTEMPSKKKAYKFFETLKKIFGIKGYEIQNGDKYSQSSDIKSRKYNESLSAKALFAGIGGFVYGLFLLIQSGYVFYGMFGAVMLILGTPVLVLMLGGVDSENVVFRGGIHSFSWLVILTLAVYSSKNTSILGLWLCPLICMLFTLFVMRFRGVVPGILCGILFGLIYAPLYAPLLVICVLIFALVSPLKKSFAPGGVCIAVVLWCYYFGGADGLVNTLTPMLVALPIFWLCDKYYPTLFPERDNTEKADEPVFSSKHSSGVYFAEAVSQREKSQSMRERLDALSSAFSSLSETFNSLLDKFRRPDMLGVREITEDVMQEKCDNCRNKDVCWGAEYEKTLDISNKISSGLHRRGFAEKDDLPEEFFARCPNAEKIISEVNDKCSQVTENIIESQKIGLFASNFGDISQILRDALSGEGEEYECDISAGEKIFEFLVSANYKVKGVVVCGKRNKRVIVKGAADKPESHNFSCAGLCEKIGEIVGAAMSGPVFEMSDGETVMMFYSKPVLSAVCSHGKMPSDECVGKINIERDIEGYYGNTDPENIFCGDSTRVFVNENSYFYSLISDGMGTGEEAALSSEICSMFVEKMLMAGNRADITVRMLNNFLRSENLGLGRECSATLDLFELDLMSGVASFIKSGAAPTYICRQNKVYKINSRTMPMGIIKEADAKLTKFNTKAHDLVIMISDGCCPDSEDCPWLSEYLSGLCIPLDMKTPEQMENFTGNVKNKILSLACQNTPIDKQRDDISVSVVLICA